VIAMITSDTDSFVVIAFMRCFVVLIYSVRDAVSAATRQAFTTRVPRVRISRTRRNSMKHEARKRKLSPSVDKSDGATR
jgi:hypothetical protein